MEEEIINNHSMITRSKKRKGESIYVIDEENDCNYEQIDKDGNLLDLIDDTEKTDFDNKMFQKELSRLRGTHKKIKQPKRYKHKNKSNNILDIILPYILMNILSKGEPKKKKLKKLKIEQTNAFSDLINIKDNNIHMEVNELDDGINSEEYEDQDELSIDSEEDTDEESEEELLSLDDSEEENDSSILSYSEEEDTDEEYDDLDNEFIELIENDLDNNEELEYFSNLKSDDKQKHIKDLNEIKENNRSNIPLRFKILDSNMDLRTKSIAIENINKLSEMDISTGEYCKMDKWINGLIKIPFGIYNQLEIDNENTLEEKQDFLSNTYTTLDKAIYGHTDAKIHILQVIGKWIKNPSSQGNVLALQGPMGNGKTTLVKEGIAKAINRPFAFIALGGASDSAYFDGHSYTYEGSHWGRIIDILIDSKCMNPIIYFDELDKVSETHKGEEIIHLLTHLTDPSQNTLFQDNYFPGIHINLSKTLFIFSFNDETKVDRILKDRMYVINTKGFNPKDKVMICNNYILPELMETFLFKKEDIHFNDEAILYIIDRYTLKEEGVRNLKRCLETIISKINIYSLSNKNNEEGGGSIPLSFKVKGFKFPLEITKDIVDILVKPKDDSSRPPEHMYL